MPDSVQNLKKRIKSVANINKITKAMELVAATKMRKAQEVALASRPYAFVALDLLANVKSQGIQLPQLLQQRKVKKVLFVVVASDKGLAGAFNSSVFKKFEKHLKEDEGKYPNEEKFFIAVGEKSFAYLSKKGFSVIKKFVQVGDHISPEQVEPFTDFIVKGYLEKKWDRVVVFSTHFKSALRQEPHTRRLLPIQADHLLETIKELVPETGRFSEFRKEIQVSLLRQGFGGQARFKIQEHLIEPSANKVLEKLATHLFFMQMYQLILEANASEHSARRMAMKTASDNASELSDALNLQYNKSRQAGITNQIIEISAGAEALN